MPKKPLVRVLCSSCATRKGQPSTVFALTGKAGAWTVWIRRTYHVTRDDHGARIDPVTVDTSITKTITDELEWSVIPQGVCDRHGQVVVYGKDLADALKSGTKEIRSAPPNHPTRPPPGALN